MTSRPYGMLALPRDFVVTQARLDIDRGPTRHGSCELCHGPRQAIVSVRVVTSPVDAVRSLGLCGDCQLHIVNPTWRPHIIRFDPDSNTFRWSERSGDRQAPGQGAPEPLPLTPDPHPSR